MPFGTEHIAHIRKYSPRGWGEGGRKQEWTSVVPSIGTLKTYRCFKRKCEINLPIKDKKCAVRVSDWYRQSDKQWILSINIVNNRLVHALSCTMGNQGKFTKMQSCKPLFLFSLIRPDFKCGDQICTISGETSSLGLLAFLSRSSDCCGG